MGRTMARCGLGILPPFPSSPLSCRKAGFPRYGWKAGLLGGPSDVEQLKPAPGIHWPTFGFLRPSCFSVDPPKVGSVDAMYCTTMQWVAPLYPGVLAPDRLCCPIHHHLVDPIRPARGHIPTSSHRLIWDASAVRERLGHPRAVPVFRCTFLAGMPSPETPGFER